MSVSAASFAGALTSGSVTQMPLSCTSKFRPMDVIWGRWAHTPAKGATQTFGAVQSGGGVHASGGWEFKPALGETVGSGQAWPYLENR